MTREEFMAQLAEGGATEEWLTRNGLQVNPCDCGVDYCTGWSVEFTPTRDMIERAKAARGVTKQPCPSCGRHIDSAANRQGEVPQPGDISLCIYCSCVMEFTAEGPFRIVPQSEIDTFPVEFQKRLAGMLLEIEMVRALQGRPRLNRE